MRKLLITAGVAIMAAYAAPAQADWIAVAMNYNGTGFGTGGSEEDARQDAISACEQRTGRDCSWPTTSVPDSWYVVGLRCGGEPTTGGSRHSEWQAKQNAANKVGSSARRCRTSVSR